jgi:hypothetical protein
MRMFRVVVWHAQGRGYDGPPMPWEQALAHAGSLRRSFCKPGGGLLSVGIEEV